MAPPATTDELLDVLDRNGWSTTAFRRAITAADVGLAPPPPQLHAPRPSAPPIAPDAAPAAAAAREPTALPRISDFVAREAAVAYGRIRQFVRHTPLDPSAWLSGLAPGGGCRAALKMESEQHTGAFKARGAVNKLLCLPSDVLSRGVYTASTGNHALAVLYACEAVSAARASTQAAAAATAAAGGGDQGAAEAEAGGQTAEAGAQRQAAEGPLRPLLYLPQTASPYKVRKLQALGGRVVLVAGDCLAAESAARAAAAAAGATYVSPYNDAHVMAGGGTVALELLAARRSGELDVVLVPVGGGGLIGGVAAVLKAADPRIRVVGCQPALSNVMARSVAAGAIQPDNDQLEPNDPNWSCGANGTLSDATAGGVESGAASLQPCRDCVDEWVAVGEGEIAECMVALLEEHSKLVEGAAACALAALRRLAPGLEGRHVVAVCCGGNIALPTLRRAIDMARPQPQPHALADSS